MYIIDFGVYIPEKREDTFEINKVNNYPLNFIKNKLGFKQLSKKDSNETVKDMCIKAFENLNNKIELNIDDIDLIVVVTQSSNYKIPHISALLHNYLNAQECCMTFDISQGCAGYTYALNIVQSLMHNNNYNEALIFTCDPYSDVINPYDKKVNMIFGDAATVSYVNSQKGKLKIIDSNFGISKKSNDCLKIEDTYLNMDGQRVFNYALKNVPQSISKLLEKNNLDINSIDHYIFHQGTKYMVEAVAKKLKISTKELFCAQDYGNTISSSIPIQLYYKNFEKNKKIIISGFGVGFSWGNTILKTIY
ncbi:3-oxoacyl-ACP synthase III family protein [Staphylococcus gallinarum]|uniref:3-oxoacyl-ACP synthase III family protein n=1 Tax=Staphylococcus gallinarum TaxID=1293 RepID=UPI002DB7F108|nr:ketoacyl-ACP synthase III [Staphylococcus gallinarum]MEB7040088.1 ketoacyl-ACP synthase III [Staphylococcus gallinarum]